MNGIRLFFRYLGVSMRGQLQYRASFVMLSLGHFIGTGMEFLGLWALFDRFGSLRGWSLPEVALFYGLVNIAFSFTDGLGRGFDWVGTLIKRGDFDRILLRPRSTALQVAAQELTLRRIGRLVQGIIVTGWAASQLPVPWTGPKLLLILVTLVGCACFFYGLFVLQGTLSFWTTETLEIMNTVTYGGVETSQYPLAIYRPWFRRFFTVILPMGCVTYFPILAILERPDPLGSSVAFQWAAPLAGILFLLIALRIWHFGVRHYRSTGS
jgi:ABC-2 type transport system permease protein